MKTYSPILFAAVAALLICRPAPAQQTATPSCCDKEDEKPVQVAGGARCTGSASCRACTNCSRCAHCSAGGSCGVCAGTSTGRGSSSGATYTGYKSYRPPAAATPKPRRTPTTFTVARDRSKPTPTPEPKLPATFTDRYGRTVADISVVTFAGNGDRSTGAQAQVNREMVKRGMAWWYKQ